MSLSGSNLIFLAGVAKRNGENETTACESERNENQEAEKEKNARQSPREIRQIRIRGNAGCRNRGGMVSASRRRDGDVGLSDCAVGGRAGRRPWNFHVNKISGRGYGASRAREGGDDDDGKRKRKGREEMRRRGVRYTLASPHASAHSRHRATSRFTRCLRRNNTRDTRCVCTQCTYIRVYTDNALSRCNETEVRNVIENETSE